MFGSCQIKKYFLWKMSDRWKNKKERPGLTLVLKKFNLSRRAQESFQNFKKIIHYYMFFFVWLIIYWRYYYREHNYMWSWQWIIMIGHDSHPFFCVKHIISSIGRTMSIVACSMTRIVWLEYLFNIWPFTTMKIAR